MNTVPASVPASRAERRRAVRAARKESRLSPYGVPAETYPAPYRGSALKRARAHFLDAIETGEGHPYHGLSVREIRDIEAERKPVPNRAVARRFGIRAGYTKRLHKRLAVARAMRHDEAIFSDPVRLEAHAKKRELAKERAARRAARRAA